MRIIPGFLVALWGLAPEVSNAAVVTLNPGTNSSSVGAFAWDGSGSTGVSTQYPAVVPFSGGPTNSDGANSATTAYAFGHDMFEFTLTNTRDANLNSVAESYSNGVFFSVDSNTDYLLEGTYAVVDALGRRIKQELRLTDLTTSTTLFENIQLSEATPNESFTLGLTEGDVSNTLTGSLTGTLIAGNEYRLTFDTLTQNQPAAGGSASASGFFRLTFVPEPSSAILSLLGVGVLLARRRR